MLPGVDLGEVSGWGAFVALAVFYVVSLSFERIVPGRTHRRLADREALKDQTIRDQAAALAELKMTSQAAARLLAVLPPLVEQQSAPATQSTATEVSP